MAAALPPSTAPPLLTRHSAAGLLPFRLERRPGHGGCCTRRLPAVATAGATSGLTRRATAAAARGRAQAGEGAEEGSPLMVLLSTAVAVCGSLEFGTCVGYSAPAQAGIVSDTGLSNSQGATMLYLGRVLLGYCTGVLSYVVPVFISEIAPKDLRGGLAASNQLFICSGCSAAYIIGAMISWRSLVIVGLVPCVFLLVGLPFIPESPRWLANIGREKEFRVSLQKLRGEEADISGEATEIIEYIESVQNLPKARIQDLFDSKNMYAVIVGVGLMVFQQLGGINALGFYTNYIFSSAGFSGKLGTTLIGIIQIPITLFGALLMDRSGRRTLLLVSSSGTFVGCFLTGLSFYFKAQGLYTQLVPTLALYGILAYYGAYSIGMGPVPWVIMSEIFSIDMKGIAGSLVTLVSWIGSFAISYSFSFLMDWNSAGTFFLFSASSLVSVLFVARLVPETKGRTLEEIQESLMAGT